MQQQSINQLVAVQRLTALWALSECGLGGIMHAVKSPFTGLIVGSISVAIIALIAYWSDNKIKNISTALIIVLIIKLSISPHSNFMSYFAVSFQAALGIAVFSIFSNTTIASMLLASLSLAESAVQKIIGLTIIYGKTLWDSIDIWGASIVKQFTFLSTWKSSQLVMLAYLGTYITVGLAIGWMISRLIKKVEKEKDNKKYQITLTDQNTVTDHGRSSKKFGFAFIGISILLLLGITYISIQEGEAKWNSLIYLLVRMIVVLGLWWFVLGPFLMGMLKKFLLKQKAHYATEISATIEYFPYLRYILQLAWKESSGRYFFQRFFSFLSHSVLYTLNAKIK